MMQWERLLSPARLGKSDSEPLQAQRSPFQRDYDRIVFSSAFRRLQDKTQVFPLAESDYVRTRLTHSLEAGCVGRSLGTKIGRGILERHRLDGVHPSDVGDVVAAACLAHDIGNPPFGHSGEDAIRHWFTTSPQAKRLHAELKKNPVHFSDFERFEGNAQGFRILTRLQMPDNHGGLQLTCATLGAFAKYPVASHPERDPNDPRASTKKHSFFHAESELFAEVAERTGLLLSNNGWRRHPLALIVEAADDICYRLVDFEDGVRLRLIGYEEASEAFAKVIGERKYLDIAKRMNGTEERIEFLRAVAIGKAVEQVAAVFLQNEEAILAGAFEQPLIRCTQAAEPLEEIVCRSRKRLYANPRGVEIEAAGFEVIGGLLDLFVEGVEALAANHGKLAPRWRNLLQILPEPFVGPGGTPAPDAYTRLLRMTDYVSGMTDSQAVCLYKKLRGISLPGQ
ncbi:MAG: deoxyguanosinetriphosphate triphosphohydrolase [Verrucomicrobia bacterium]|nr:deoxyguanosinetriphosphate triphosphohydrolase [Verrucomicrobiota bacterium]